MARLKQAHLKISSDRTVCLVRCEKAIITGEDWTAKLPDELLIEVFEYLAPQDWKERQESKHLLSMSRRWRRLFERFYYRCLDLGYEGFDKRIRLAKLLRTLRARPDLCKSVREIPVTLWKTKISTCQMVAEILSVCSQAREISMHTRWENVMPIFEKVVSIHNLEKLDLSGYDDGPSLAIFSKVMELSMLNSLALRRYHARIPNESGVVTPQGQSALSSYLDKILPVHRQRSGSITKLTLSDPYCSAEVTSMITRWPARLTELYLTSLHHSGYGQEYSAAAIQRIIDPHHRSLKHIELGKFGSRNETGSPVFAHFTALETLHVSQSTLFRENPVAAFSRLSSPSLRFVRVCFSPQDQHSEILSDFGPEEAQWLTEFAAAKAAQPQAGLKQVLINFWPELYPGYYSRPDDCHWPLEHMKRAQLAFESHGLEMSFNSSISGTKQEWLDSLEAYREREEREWEEEALVVVEDSEEDAIHGYDDLSVQSRASQ